ncbi:MAG TPA: hypothetical protein VK002_12370 [Rubricoccaceae bacterium]|nr:hypothetical protein [Rubricoccaceae bacterium]
MRHAPHGPRAAAPSTVHRLLSTVFLLAVGNLALPAAAQVREAEFRVHDRGELWETAKDDGTLGAPAPLDPFEYFPSMDWPGGPAELETKEEQRSYHAGAGLWIGGRRGGSVFFTEHGPLGFSPGASFEPIEEVENFVESPGYDPAEAEETIVARFTTGSGLMVRRTSRAWSFRGLNTFILLDYAVTNVSGEALTDVYVGFPYLLRPSYQDVNVHNGWGDDFNRDDDVVAYDTARALVYARDDTPNFDLPGDVGNYWAARDELRTTGYAGVALLDAPAGTGGQAQPATVFWAQLLNNGQNLSLSGSSPQALYAILSGEDTSLQAAPDERITPFVLMAVGPYDLGPSESVRITLVEAVNGLPLEVAVEGLAAQEELPAALDSLRASVDRAAALADSNFNALRLRVTPPPAPALEIIPLPSSRSVSVSWPPIEREWVDPLPLSAGRITEYRVYRSERGFIGPYERVGRVRVGNETDSTRYYDEERNLWQFVDNGVGLGFAYHYAVTAVDGDGQESWLTNRNVDPVTVSSSAAPDAMNVSVFPNPFRLTSGFPSTDDANSIVFNNLPARATIRIYTASGELIRVIEHDDPNTGQAVWDQLSTARQRTAPGIYFYTVDSPAGTARGSIVIIK